MMKINQKGRKFKVEMEEDRSYLYEEVESFKHLGVTITRSLERQEAIQESPDRK